MTGFYPRPLGPEPVGGGKRERWEFDVLPCTSRRFQALGVHCRRWKRTEALRT